MAETINPRVTQEVVRQQFQTLDAIFAPKNVAVIGATENIGSVGRTIMWNLITNPFGGAVFPVNPKRPSVLGVKAYPTIRDVPDQVDLAVIVTPSKSVPALIQDCVDLGIRGAIIISAGFKEIGPEGVALEQQILATAKGKMRIIGPNCLGVMMPHKGLNATFAGAMARPGNVGFISQSGALLTSVLDWSFKENVGFSSFISIGSMLDVNWGDLISYLGDDPQTSSIVVYMETVGDARSFLSAAREVARDKPIIVIKAGRTEAAAHAAASHTGSLAGSDDVLDMAFRRAGILRVDKISDIFYTVEALAKQPRPRGKRLTILTNAGGPGVLATDSLISDGGELAEITPETVEKLSSFLPAAWSHSNPIDVLGDAGPDKYAKALEIAAQDANSDGLLVILTPQAMTDPTETANLLKPYAHIEGKPVLASWMGGEVVAEGEAILNKANIPTLPYPDTAARLFNYMWKFSLNLRGLYETPVLPLASSEQANSLAKVEAMIQQARQDGRTILTETESKQVLAAYDIPTIPMYIAPTEEEAVAAADTVGYPVVLKLHSETITHKSDVGGVKLNLGSAEMVREAFRQIYQSVSEKANAADFLGVSVQPMIKLDGYELIIGASPDPQFGPVLLFGMGGILVEVFKDRALGLPPLNTTLARRMMEQTTIYTALKGVRGRKSVDMGALEQLLVRFSQLVTEQKWIKEIDINPLVVSSDHILALDARVVLYDKNVSEDQLPKLAIRPYPTQYVGNWTMKNEMETVIRPIRPEDEPLMAAFHQTISERSVMLRYFYPLALNQRIEHERLSRISFIDYDREMALVAEILGRRGEREIIAAGRLIKLYGGQEAEFTILVSDAYQGYGLGSEMLRRLVDIGKQEGLKRIYGNIVGDNTNMVRVTERQGFRLVGQEADGRMRVELVL
ncbi:MAG: bifunctional acetate--CoA ligase family protein/GNAT family N-acetyltransferase [Chloroflexi bacterium]|nr:bifunctional acetate--CoA ligase family protein/GNAT family N-acetyltransferase [Chloroflexota bacterium]MCC6893102.1 bifunctional acetate--CoA ligase family protein/GNAT family N-acetyltransferase [Anaerolineae bacterium]